MTFSFAMKCHFIKQGAILVLGNVPRLLRILFPIFQYTKQHLPVKLIPIFVTVRCFQLPTNLWFSETRAPNMLFLSFFSFGNDDVMWLSPNLASDVLDGVFTFLRMKLGKDKGYHQLESKTGISVSMFKLVWKFENMLPFNYTCHHD